MAKQDKKSPDGVMHSPLPWEELAVLTEKRTGISITYEGCASFSPGMNAARFGLTNGLKIVLMRDRRAPIFAYQTWFRVGSRNEKPTRTGMAHLFEHLMFKGTKQHPTGEFDREMELRGSETNAATWVDWTFYTESLSNDDDHFDVVVDFEVDRMTGLILDEETFRSELEVVKNERRMCIDDSASGTLNQTLYQRAFGPHPYGWPTLGMMEDLEAISIDELHEFYRTHYAPNNATIVVVGDLDFEAVLTKLAESYHGIPSQPLPSYDPKPVEIPNKLEPLELDLPISSPQWAVGFIGLAQSDQDYPALELLTELLANGESSRLYQRLVIEQELALDVGGYLTPFAEPGLVEFSLVARPDVEPNRLLEAFQEELDFIATHGVELAELDKAKNSLELAWLSSVQTAEGFAEALGHFESNYGDYSMAFRPQKGWDSVGVDECAKLAQRLFNAARRVAILAQGTGQEYE